MGGDISKEDTFHSFPPRVAKANKNPPPEVGDEERRGGGARRRGQKVGTLKR